MATRLNRKGFDHAKQLINDGRFVADERDAWSEHQASAADENEFIRQNGFNAYARWHLGIDDEQPEETKGRYKFPYGDFKDVHCCAVISAESRAGQYNYKEIEMAAAHLHGMIDGQKRTASQQQARVRSATRNNRGRSSKRGGGEMVR